MFRKKGDKGFVLAYALFLLAIFGIIGVSIVSMLTTSSATSSEDFLSLQSLFIAESGAEIRIRQALAGDTNEGSKIFKFNDNDNYMVKVTFKKITDTSQGDEIFSVYATGKCFNIKRKIFIKFRK
jgi:Tfp pilus assembly protein PilX